MISDVVFLAFLGSFLFLSFLLVEQRGKKAWAIGLSGQKSNLAAVHVGVKSM